jgi:hypothetical protein
MSPTICRPIAIVISWLCCGLQIAHSQGIEPAAPPQNATSAADAWRAISPHFGPPAEFEGNYGDYRSPLRFSDGSVAETPEDWQRRRKEIAGAWHSLMGPWPELIERPNVVYLEQTRRDDLTQHRVRLEVAPGVMTSDCYLLVPDGEGPFPAVLVVFYDAANGAGLDKELLDFGYQLARRGFVALSMGSPPRSLYPSDENAQLQPLSFLAYAAANCAAALGNLDDVDPQRLGIVGHSYGAKWAMFASCLSERFACAAWSDGGIVFDESRGNVNYWEPWYLGHDPHQKRQPGIPSDQNPRTGAYAELIARGHDLHELHSLMAPRPFLVSGGSEDPPKRWQALNHTVAVNRLLGYENRVAMTNRAGHAPTPESNEQIYQFFEHVLKRSPSE